MSYDFSVDKYRELCSSIQECGYASRTLADAIEEKDHPNYLVILRHDVDRKPKNALRLAKLERDLGLVATYYFRNVSGSFNPEIMQEIVEMGHEIGFHYECLSKCKGDFSAAINLFEKELNEFRKITTIHTIAMHGSPLSPYDNRDLWKKYNFSDYGLIGEAYFSLNYQEISYLTDTGRTWNNKLNFRDKVNYKNPEIASINGTDDLISAISKKKFEKLCILTHPERWEEGTVKLGISYLTDVSVNMLKWLVSMLIER